MLTRRGWLTGVLAGVLLVLGRVFGTIEGYIAGAALAALLIGVGAVAGGHPPRRLGHPGAAPAEGPRRLVHPGRPRRGQPGPPGAAPCSPCATACRAPGAPRCSWPRSTPAARPGPPTASPPSAAASSPSARCRSSSPTRSGSPGCACPPPASPSSSSTRPIEALPAVPLSAGNDPLAGSEHPNALGRGGEDFFALRAYVVGDDLRRVHWPATARHDELMVRQDELPWQGRTTVVIDDRAGVHTAESFERMVSAAASILVAGTRRQDLVRVVTASGSDSGFGAGRSHVEGLLEALACIEPQGGTDLAGAGEVLGATGVSGALVVLTGGAAPDELTRLVARAEPSGPEALLSFAPGATGGPTVAGPVVQPGLRHPPGGRAGPRPCAAAPAARAPPPGGRDDHHPAAPHGARPRRRAPRAARRAAGAGRPRPPAPRRGPRPPPAAHRGRPRRHDLRRGRAASAASSPRGASSPRCWSSPSPATSPLAALPPAGLRRPDHVRHHHRRVAPGRHAGCSSSTRPSP